MSKLMYLRQCECGEKIAQLNPHRKGKWHKARMEAIAQNKEPPSLEEYLRAKIMSRLESGSIFTTPISKRIKPVMIKSGELTIEAE